MNRFGFSKHQVRLLALIIIVVIALAGISYALVVQFFSGSETPKVTWTNTYGSVIQSITLSYTAPGSASGTVRFTCSPDAGPLTLSLTPSLQPTVTLSQTNFPSCGSTPNSVTLTASSTGILSLTGTLHVTQNSNNYRTLAVPLQITVQGT